MLAALAIALPAGTIAALRRNTWADLACSAWALFGVSVPSFWLGLMLIYLFAVRLRWVPLQGYVAPSENLAASLHGMVLPAVTLGVFLSGPLTRYLRAGILAVVEQEHVRVARAKGLRERRVVVGHVLRNSLIPFVTVLGVQFGYLLGGAVIIEQIFALPGVGRLAVQAIGNRDFPVVQGTVLLVAVVGRMAGGKVPPAPPDPAGAPRAPGPPPPSRPPSGTIPRPVRGRARRRAPRPGSSSRDRAPGRRAAGRPAARRSTSACAPEAGSSGSSGW